MKTVSWTGIVSIVIVCHLSADQGQVESKTRLPNIVLMVADDLGYADLGCYGNSKVVTPNIDRLAAEGMRFTDFHSNGAQCSPTRAALLTGRYQQRAGMDEVGGVLSDDTVVIAERLRDEAGYATGIFGKWHVSGHNRTLEEYRHRMPTDYGFDEFRGFMGGFIDPNNHHNSAGALDWWRDGWPVVEEGYSSRLLVDHVVRFIRESRDRPFFVYLAFSEPHFPYLTPEDPPYYKPGAAYPRAGDPAHSRLGPHDGSPALQKVVHRMIHELDRGVGRVMDVLRDTGVRDDTLVFFVSDNGGYVYYQQFDVATQSFVNMPRLNVGQISDNGPLRGQKAELYEGGHRVPAIASWPGRIPAGTATAEVGMTMDLYPTFLALAGLKTPPADDPLALDGVSLLPLLTRREPLPPRLLYWFFQHREAIRDGHWKLVRNKPASPELYNLEDDIAESVDLSGRQPELTSRLLRQMIAFRQGLDGPSGMDRPKS